MNLRYGKVWLLEIEPPNTIISTKTKFPGIFVSGYFNDMIFYIKEEFKVGFSHGFLTILEHKNKEVAIPVCNCIFESYTEDINVLVKDDFITVLNLILDRGVVK